MNKILSSALVFLAGGLFTLMIVSQLSFKAEAEPVTISEKNTTPLLPELPAQIDFAGEAVPLERWDVKERLDRELIYNFYYKPNVLYTLKLANRYFPAISERLKANGVPDDFKYLCVAESNLVAAAISRAGAVSFWQFMDGTAPLYQLTVNHEVDQRYDLEKSTDAACKYLKQAYERFGSWTAAAASYNCGMGGYNKQVTFQKTSYYYDLHLPEETNRYIYRILTFKHLLSNADTLGFALSDEDAYQPLPFREMEVTRTIPNLATFAIDNGTTYKVLKLMNPWIKGRSLTIRPGKRYVLKLPVH
ncbi:lytic transglycosylase domain-containing protein [Chitinophaga cymbidii]|uniref:Murein transglycosylase n=1 Tax=Chitinophaga cymbidii TaxID=1096750 RepID=A0A512RJJ4_9BACT|nr:lytic transglycosylase domain-containing protein [Chitinophaga cymbidii]GEP95854.1 murein transglycosylase [Chitinophaga cymbidii]